VRPDEVAELKEKLLSRIEIVDGPLDTPCWEWIGARSSDDRGEIYWKGKTLRTHRVSWEVHRGPIPEDMCVCHHCDNAPCFNPDHLFLGTQRDNVQDCIAKGRRATKDFGRTRYLKDEKVGQIRYLLAKGNYSQSAIGAMFGVTPGIISKINTGGLWPDVEPIPVPSVHLVRGRSL
jgi:HNH endonuclease